MSRKNRRANLNLESPPVPSADAADLVTETEVAVETETPVDVSPAGETPETSEPFRVLGSMDPVLTDKEAREILGIAPPHAEPTPTPERFEHPMFPGYTFPVDQDKIELEYAYDIPRGQFQGIIAVAINAGVSTVIYDQADKGLGRRTGPCKPVAVVVPAMEWARLVAKAGEAE